MNAQVTYDFETPETTTPIDGNQAAVVPNPDRNGNDSQTCAYYNKNAGNWSFFGFPFAHGMDIGASDRVSFKVRTSTSGRIYIKLYDVSDVILESWVVEYNYMPEPNTWTELVYDISDISGQTLSRLEIAASVDNEAQADVYFDDLKFFNSLSPDGQPIIDLAPFSACVELGTTFDLNASASTDPNGSITNFRWDMGDGTIIENVDNVSHTYQAAGFYNVQIDVTDDDQNVTTKGFRVWVIRAGEQLSSFINTSDTYLTNEKVELSFLSKTEYQNPFDSDEVSINALVTYPDGSVKTVPCFFYEKVLNENGSWMTSTGEKNWMVRFSSDQVGAHQVQLEITDAGGTKQGSVEEVNLLAGTTKGIIRGAPDNRQFYQHSTGEMYYPFGLNVSWNSTGNYAKIISNLNDGEGNWLRYWHAAFTNQALEWRDGLGSYSPIAAAKQDSIIELCKQNDVYLQMVVFHHGMFSETVNSNWEDSPYNAANGGMLVNPEEFFYNPAAKRQAKKLLRYIVARWGYSPEVFGWELFNEVQWTGNHPNQSDRWETEVIEWHDEMGQYVKEIDPFEHLVTTSAEDNQLDELADKEGIDIIQYHTYPSQKLNNDLLAKDAKFLADNPETSVICGEYGYANDANVPYEEQRLAIWSSVFSQVPHLTWRWERYTQTIWTDLFRAPATFMREEQILEQQDWSAWNLFPNSGTPGLRSRAFTQSNGNAYGLIYDENMRDDISDGTVDLSRLPAGKYTVETTDITTGEQMIEEDLEITFFSTEFQLPTFSDAIVLKATFVESLQILLAIAGYDSVTGFGYEIALDGTSSLQPDNATVISNWSVVRQPAASEFTIPEMDERAITVIPDLPGEYSFVLTMTDVATQEVSMDTVNVLVSSPPVAVAGEDITVELGDRPMLNGRGSFDPEQESISYAWTLVSKPAGSEAEMEFATFSLPVLDPDVVGVYAVELVVTDNFNASRPDTVIVTVDMSTFVVDVDESSSILLFPNPASEVLNIEFTEFIGQSEIDLIILDMTGRVIATQQSKLVGRENLSFPLNNLWLNNGMYLLKVVSENGAKTLPFLIQKE